MENRDNVKVKGFVYVVVYYFFHCKKRYAKIFHGGLMRQGGHQFFAESPAN
jgi:hypothetical protein